MAPKADRPDGYDADITDTLTGETRTHRVEGTWDETADFLWRDGNYSCDCNRGLFFGWAGGETGETERETECGLSRYKVMINDHGALYFFP